MNKIGKNFLYISIAIIVIISVLLVLSLSLIKSPVNSTPEKTFYSYIDRLNDGDFDGHVNLSLIHFLDPANLSLRVNHLKEHYEEFSYYHYTVWDLEIFESKDNLNISLRTELESVVNGLEDEYEIVIDDYCLLRYEVHNNIDGNVVILHRGLICLEVNSLWYMPDAYYF